jgi:hypothetical protein
MGKSCFEQWLWDMAYMEVKHYHGNNGIFSAEEYCLECKEKGQSQSFSGVGAQHQNARAERAIQRIMFMACSFMVHASLHWTDRGSDDILLWPFAVKHVVWIYNRVPNCQSGLTPLELLTKSKKLSASKPKASFQKQYLRSFLRESGISGRLLRGQNFAFTLKPLSRIMSIPWTV